MVHQFRAQLNCLPKQSIYGISSLDLTLSDMGEVEERLTAAISMVERFKAIKQNVVAELTALSLTQQAERPRDRFGALRRPYPGPRRTKRLMRGYDGWTLLSPNTASVPRGL